MEIKVNDIVYAKEGVGKFVQAGCVGIVICIDNHLLRADWEKDLSMPTILNGKSNPWWIKLNKIVKIGEL